MGSRWATAVAAALVIAFVAQSHWSVRQKSPILHEALYAYAGYQYLTQGRYEINFDSPPLLKQLAALPLLGLDLEPGEPPGFDANPAVDRFVYENRVPGDALIDRARLPFLLLPVLLGAVVFAWATELHGRWGGLFALALTVFNPALLGQAGFANHDFGLAAFSVAALWALWRLCRAPAAGRAVLAGAALGLALVSKYTAAMLVPTTLLLGLADVVVRPPPGGLGTALGRRAGHLALVLLVAGLVVWADYGFRTGALGIDTYRLALERIAPGGLLTRVVAYLPDHPVVPAPEFVMGVAVQMIHGDIGHVNYLLGEVSMKGWWYYYLLTFLWRVPLALFALVVLALATWRRGRPDGWATVWLLLYAVLTVLLFSLSPTQLGERYVLVVYPLLFVALGGLARVRAPAVVPVAVGICLAAYVATSLAAYPDYLVYFNRLAGGADAGWKKVVEGVDLGQDARGLRRFVAERGIPAIKVSCFGCPPLASLGPAFRPLACGPTTGWVAVSIRHLVMPEPFLQHGCFDWLADRTPAARIGGSIYVYDVPPGPA